MDQLYGSRRLGFRGRPTRYREVVLTSLPGTISFFNNTLTEHYQTVRALSTAGGNNTANQKRTLARRFTTSRKSFDSRSFCVSLRRLKAASVVSASAVRLRRMYARPSW